MGADSPQIFSNSDYGCFTSAKFAHTVNCSCFVVHGCAQPSPRFFSSSLCNEDFDVFLGIPDAALPGRSSRLRAFGRGVAGAPVAGLAVFPMASVPEGVFVTDGGGEFSAKAAHGHAENRQHAASIARSGLRIFCPRIALHINDFDIE